MSGPRFFQIAKIRRPIVGDFGDVTLGPATRVKAAVWHRKLKAVIGGQGELMEVTAVGFFPPATDLQVRDRITVDGTSLNLEVLHVISGYDDRGVTNHVGAEMRDVD